MGNDNHVCIIAEAGVNHNGDINIAKRLVDIAKDAGVDYIKFQTFNPEKLVSREAKKANYQVKNTGEDNSQLDMLKKLALTYDDFQELKTYCDNVGIGFISTPFDLDSIDFLNKLNMDFWKIPSGEITNLPYLEKIASTNMDVVMSTGMSTIGEIKAAINVLENNGAGQISVLHCNTQYPTPFEDVNLLAMNTIQNETKKVVGYSDHTEGIEISLAAVALGAKIIEKHFTLDKNMEGPDHKASIESSELKELVIGIRNIEKARGDGIKKLSASERENINVARKSIVASKNIKAGEIFTKDNITTKRPGTGVSPMKWYDLVGRSSKRNYLEDEVIKADEL